MTRRWRDDPKWGRIELCDIAGCRFAATYGDGKTWARCGLHIHDLAHPDDSGVS